MEGSFANMADDVGIQSLPLLQTRIKSDPESYAQEFETQWEHLLSGLSLFSEAPQKADNAFSEQIMFIASTASYYEGRAEALNEKLIAILRMHAATMHQQTRRLIVNALLMSLARGKMQLISVLPLFFDLMDLGDKHLRKLLMSITVKHIAQRKLMVRGSQHRGALQKLFLTHAAEEGTEERRRRCLKIIVELYRRNAWRDDQQINAVAECCFAPQLRVALTAAQFLLGMLSPLTEDDDEEDSEAEKERRHTGAKKTRSLKKKMEREKELREKRQERRAQRRMAVSSIGAAALLDSLRDPHHFAEKLVERIRGSKLTMGVKLALLNLCSRIIGRFELLLLNFYPLLARFLDPKKSHVTQVLAAAAQAVHPLVPPADLQDLVRKIMDLFVTEVQTPEVMAVGLNSIREICARAPLSLSEAMLADLVEFRRVKHHKAVIAAARSLLNLYRDIYPELLQRKLRGKASAMEVSAAVAPKPEYGQLRESTLLGTPILPEKRKRESFDSGDLTPAKRRKQADGSSVAVSGGLDPTKVIFDDEDFKQLKKMQQRRLAMKRNEEYDSDESDDDEASTSDEDPGSDTDSENEVDEGTVDPEELKARIKVRGRAARLALVHGGREGRLTFAEKNKERARAKKGSLPQSVQKRNKPLMMVKQKFGVRLKNRQDAATKISNLRKHIKTIKMHRGGKRKYRRS